MVFIIVALMFIAFILIGYLRERKRKEIVVSEKSFDMASPLAGDIYLHPSHSFARVLSEDVVEIGMDEFAVKAFGKIDAVELPKTGDSFKQGDVVWKVKIGNRYLSQRMPVGGIVEGVNTDPSSAGEWFIKAKATNLKKDLSNLIQSSSVLDWLKKAQEEFVAAFSAQPVPVLQDGGELVDGFATNLSDDQWKEFSREFFDRVVCEQ